MLPEDTAKARAITTINQKKVKELIIRARGLKRFFTKTIGHPENILGGHFLYPNIAFNKTPVFGSQVVVFDNSL